MFANTSIDSKYLDWDWSEQPHTTKGHNCRLWSLLFFNQYWHNQWSRFPSRDSPTIFTSFFFVRHLSVQMNGNAIRPNRSSAYVFKIKKNIWELAHARSPFALSINNTCVNWNMNKYINVTPKWCFRFWMYSCVCVCVYKIFAGFVRKKECLHFCLIYFFYILLVTCFVKFAKPENSS